MQELINLCENHTDPCGRHVAKKEKRGVNEKKGRANSRRTSQAAERNVEFA